MEEKFLFFPKFPKGTMGLRRGSLIIAVEAIPQLGVPQGTKLPLGFDGRFIRCNNLTWNIENLEDSISRGVWEVSGDVLDLTDLETAIKFIKTIEKRTVTWVYYPEECLGSCN